MFGKGIQIAKSKKYNEKNTFIERKVKIYKMSYIKNFRPKYFLLTFWFISAL